MISTTNTLINFIHHSMVAAE